MTVYLRSLGENADLGLKLLTHKLAMLLALVSAHRSSDLVRLTLQGKRQTPLGIFLKPSGLAKQSRPGQEKGIIRELFNAGLAQATLRAYKSGCDKYVRVCKEVGVNPFPATEESASLFVVALYRKGLAGGSVKSYLAAVRFSQIALGLGDPKMQSGHA